MGINMLPVTHPISPRHSLAQALCLRRPFGHSSPFVPSASLILMDPKVLIPTDQTNVFSLGPVELDDPSRILDADQLPIPLHAEKQSLEG